MNKAAVFIFLVCLFSIVSCSDSNEPLVIRFSDSERPALIGTEGISVQESWGQWTDSNLVKLKFKKSLPKNFRVDLKMNPSFGSVVGQQIVCLSGGVSKSFMAADKAQVAQVEFNDIPAETKELIINIPGVKSPKELGLSADERHLGLALIELTITPTQRK